MLKRKISSIILVIGLVAIAVTISVFILVRNGDRFPIPDAEPSFTGDPRSLKATIIAPTLDASIDGQTNVIWCASFLAAWKALEADLAKEPPSLRGAPKVALDLNMASDPRPHISQECLYTAAGWNHEGITEKITKDLARMFPTKPPPNFPGIAQNSFVAYAYLEANVKFSLPYFQNQKPLMFTDYAGVKTKLSSFGIRQEDDYAYFKLRRQPQILFKTWDKNYMRTDYIIDLDRTSTPNQIILAMVTPKPTLLEMLSTIKEKIDTTKERQGNNDIGPNDVLLVPDMVWNITHRFVELEGQEFANPKLIGQRIDVAQQDIQFRLDRSGAELKSEAKMYMCPTPTYYIVDRPFLIVMKKRGADTPYFVMWVANAELLRKW
jgi:hypothetical protein